MGKNNDDLYKALKEDPNALKTEDIHDLMLRNLTPGVIEMQRCYEVLDTLVEDILYNRGEYALDLALYAKHNFLDKIKE